MQTRTCPNNPRQRGAILVISMMLLLMLTIIGVTAMNVVTIEERMAGNLRDANIAFQGAEAALRDGEDFLAPLIAEPATCTGAPCSVWDKDAAALADMAYKDRGWWDSNGQEYGVDGTLEIGRNQDPHSIIEFQEFVRDSLTVGHAPPPTGRVFYRVTGWSEGGSEDAIAVLQTTVAKRFN